METFNIVKESLSLVIMGIKETDCHELLEIVKESLSLVIIGAGVIIAGMALYTWKKEFIGKKKIDLACDIVEQVCNMKDLINQIRRPEYLPSELEEIRKELKERNIEIKEDKIFYLIPKYRMRKHREEIESFLRLGNKAQLYWDKEILNLFIKLSNIFRDIMDTSESLYSKSMPKDVVYVAKRISFDNFKDNDEIYVKVQKIVDEFKTNLEPLYKDRLTKWKKLKK